MKKILIVDDAPENIRVFSRRLMEAYEVRSATSGQEALMLVHEQLPSLILLDVKMPGMDGYEVLKRLKEDPATQDIPVIFVTADNSWVGETQALRSGAADFIHKPVNLDVLESRVALQLAFKAQELALQQLNESLERKIEQRTRELRLAKEEAEVANRAKSDFLNNISHEMLTPVHQVSGLLQLLQMSPNSPMLGDWIMQAQKATKRLSSVIGAVLRLTELNADEPLACAPLDIRALVRESLQGLQLSAEFKGLVVDTRIESMPPGLIGDASLIGSAVRAYLSNAIKFTESGRIEIEVRLEHIDAEGALVRFSVKDTGIGFGEEVKQRLFNLFEQADNSSTRRFQGTGLGLVTVKKIAQRLGGDVGCESRFGSGSEFWFSVRLERAP